MIRGLLVALALSALVILSALLAVTVSDGDLLRAPLAWAATRVLGHGVSIRGGLKVAPGWAPRFEARDVVVANAPGGAAQDLARVGRVAFHLDLAQLVQGRVVLPDLELEQPDVMLERRADGTANWAPPRGTVPPRLGGLTVERGRVRWRDASAALDLDATVTGSLARALQVTASGRFRDQPFELQGRVSRAAATFPFDMEGRSGDATLALRGTVADPATLAGFAADMEAAGPGLGRLQPLLGRQLPGTPPFHLVGRVERKGKVWSVADLSARIGSSDLNGSVQIEQGGARPEVRAGLTSRRLDPRDLAGFLGLPSAPAGGDDVARMLPERPLDLAWTRSADVDITLDGDQVRLPGVDVDRVHARLQVGGGLVRLAPVELTLAGGRIVVTATVETEATPVRVVFEAEARRLAVARLFARSRAAMAGPGAIGGRVRIAARGASLAALAGSMEGGAALIMQGGQARGLPLLLSRAGLGGAAHALLAGGEGDAVRCLLGDFALRAGTMPAQVLAVDTDSRRIQGHGTVDWREERYDLALTALPRHGALPAAYAPQRVDGTLRQPQVQPATGAAADGDYSPAPAAVAAALAVLLPLVERSAMRDDQCRALALPMRPEPMATPPPASPEHGHARPRRRGGRG